MKGFRCQFTYGYKNRLVNLSNMNVNELGPYRGPLKNKTTFCYYSPLLNYASVFANNNLKSHRGPFKIQITFH